MRIQVKRAAQNPGKLWQLSIMLSQFYIAIYADHYVQGWNPVRGGECELNQQSRGCEAVHFCMCGKRGSQKAMQSTTDKARTESKHLGTVFLSVWKSSQINQDLTGNSTESRPVEINCGCQLIPSQKFLVVSCTLFYAALWLPFLGHNRLATWPRLTLLGFIASWMWCHRVVDTM